MTQTRPIRVFPGMDLWKPGGERLFSPDDAKLAICKSGLLESLSQPLQRISSCCRQVHQKAQMPGLSMGALCVVLLLKESGSNRPVMLGKRMDFGIRRTWLCHLIVVCFGTHLSGPGYLFCQMRVTLFTSPEMGVGQGGHLSRRGLLARWHHPISSLLSLMFPARTPPWQGSYMDVCSFCGTKMQS